VEVTESARATASSRAAFIPTADKAGVDAIARGSHALEATSS
jgi:hypothetical protein